MKSKHELKDEYDSLEDFWEDIAKHLGVKRYSEEYNRFIWTNILFMKAEDYDRFFK